MSRRLRFLLLQIRNADDPIRVQERLCFAQALQCEVEQIDLFDLLSGVPSAQQLNRVDMVLLGGSGHYSAAGEGAWLDQAMESLREVYDLAKPTFASCWGFQAMARALGGQVVHDPERAELGTIEITCTEAGTDDPVFQTLGERFDAQAGHEDRVAELPPGAIRLALTDRVDNQAYRFADRPIYATQFHPELNRDDLIGRVRAYPEYVERIAGEPIERFIARCRETPQAASLLPRFVEHVFGHGGG